MKKIELAVNIPEKTLKIDGKPMRLEDTFFDAYIDHPNSKEPVVNLKYEGSFSGDNSPLHEEFDKLRETYGESLCERLNISGNYLNDGQHYLSFYGGINPVIKR